MPTPITIRCPGCGGVEFHSIAEPRTAYDFNGATCVKCQRVISERDIAVHLKRRANDVMRQVVKKFKSR